MGSKNKRMENTLENKARFFGSYPQGIKETDFSGMYTIDVFSEQFHVLELKPLSSISKEDLIQVSKYIGQDRGVGFEEIVKRNVFGYMYGRLMPSIEIHKSILVIDFLRSRGYALPFMGLSVEELVNRGWVKLKVG